MQLPLAASRADRKAELAEMRRAIEASRERVASYERDERGLLEALESLDRAARLLAVEVGVARRAADAARAELAAIEERLGALEKRAESSRRALAARARALYRAGEVGSVGVLFASRDLPDFLARVASLRRLLDHDVELLARHRERLAEVEAARAEARASADVLARAEAELEARSAELATERGRKRTLVRAVGRDRSRERAALVELERAARALEETLVSLGDAAGAPAGASVGSGFAALRGRLAAPVRGKLVERFGRQVDAEFRTQTFQSGVVYEAREGTRVEAVADASVRYAGWFRGYGRLVILDHGDGYFTVSGHLDELDVAVGDRVEARARIGSVGETGSLAGPRLYFEVRRGGQALDPADWLH